MTTALRIVPTSIIGSAVFCLLLFVPAGTLHYWQAWVFLVVFAASTWIPTIYLLRNDRAALERRMHAGRETRALQKIVIVALAVSLAALIVVSVLDHRFGWSSVPAAVSLAGDVLVAIGIGVAMLVVIQNSYASANITVEAGQRIVSTGLYGRVRHPMYVGDVIMMVGMPLALGSYGGLVVLLPGVAVLAVRILDEEKLLVDELAGYRDYMRHVRYRLIPYVW